MNSRDEGVTLIELLVCMLIVSVIGSALVMSFFASTRAIEASSNRMANSHDSQMAANFFSSDMQSASVLSTGTPSPPVCGADASIITFTWFGSDSTTGNELTKVASYRVVVQDGKRQLVRQFCSGPGSAVTSQSTVVIAHNLNDTTPTVTCFEGDAHTEIPCAGQDVIVAQLSASAQANDTDSTGFQYVLRATRRPST
jgi:prepilin-type N-terminal cleavage/methylation domain-containing protein